MGRQVRYGIRLHVIARDTAEEAWAHARRLLDGMSPERIAEYADLGLSEFILSGWPHLEEAWRVGEFLLPRFAPSAVAA